MTELERAELDEYRRQDLLRRMQGISRDHWSTAWNRGLEHDLFLMTFHEAPADYGIGAIEPSALAELKRLAELTDAWWVHDEENDKLSFIPLARAEQRFSKVIATDASGKAHSMSIPEVKQLYEHANPDEWLFETTRSPWKDVYWHVYRLKALPELALFQREEEGDWELRFGKTAVAYVKPSWADARARASES